MNITTSKRGAILMALFAVLAVVAAPAAMAAMTVDTETTDTPSESEWTDGTTATEITNSSKNATIQVDASNATAADANEDFTLRLENNETNRTFYETDENWTQVSGTHFNYTVDYETAFETLERDASDNVTVDVEVVWNESADDEESVTFQVFAQNDETNAVIASTGEDDGAQIEETGDSGLFSLNTITTLGGILGDGDNESDIGASRVTDNITVNQTGTESVLIVMDNEDLQTSFERVGEGEAGSLATTSYVEIEDTVVPVFPESADASWLDTGSQTYATVTSDGSQVTIHNANASLDSDNVTVSTTGDEALGFFTARSMLSDYGASLTTQFTVASGAFDFDGDPFESNDMLGGLALLVLVGGPAGARRFRRDR